jgi:hypothetical protein
VSKDLVLTGPQFAKLSTDIQKIIDRGRERAKTAANMEVIRTYWAIGGRIEVEGLSENAGYSTTVMERLAEALKTDRTTLIRCIQLYRAYPKAAPETFLTWSHVRLCYA